MRKSVLGRAKSVLRKYNRDERGVASVAWAISLVAILGAIGAAVDFAIYSNADARSQSIADTTALAAAIYVKTNGRPPTEEGELTEGKHSAADLGYEYKSFVNGGAEGVDVYVTYDDNAKEVTTRVVGRTDPVLIQLLGYDKIDFEATSVVSYLDIQNAFPASIALVLDNSGSMQFDDKLPLRIEPYTHTFACVRRRQEWRKVKNRRGKWVWRQVWVSFNTTCSEIHQHGVKDPTSEIRLVGLKESVIKFQTDLRARLGVEDDSERRTLRMGMLPYSTDVIAAGTQTMDWGYLEEGTDSGTTGIRGMRAIGGTNSSPPMSEAETWMLAEDAIHTQEAINKQSEDKEPLKFVIFMTDGQNSVGGWTFTPGNTGTWHRRNSDGSYRSQTSPGWGFQEGTVRRTADVDTENACRRMKNDGVEIFTIGYALEDFGRFRVNGWENQHDDELFPISQDVQTAAYNLMQNCASEPENFIKAADASQLEKAFDEIQNAIVEELIRVKS